MNNTSGDECYNNLDNKGYLLYYFTATWCKPCQGILNDVEILADKYKGKIIFFKVDISDDDNNEFCETCKVNSVPSFLLFKDRKYIDRITGANIPALINMINKYLIV
ncbi:MAG: thiol reductase thioredoxin [Nitrospinae bacterium]|nr:thiol reductase thioredoxin [Nitrospinota bacterium]|tara:strand:+ start:121 stop:441 length:321 start_codon:yes stop_codon:yes gene_type:complete